MIPDGSPMTSARMIAVGQKASEWERFMRSAGVRSVAALSLLALMASSNVPVFANGPGPLGPPVGPPIWQNGPHHPRGGGDAMGAFGAGLLGGIIGGAMSNAAQSAPADIEPCAAYQAIVNEDIAAHVRHSLYEQDLGRLNACLRRQN